MKEDAGLAARGSNAASNLFLEGPIFDSDAPSGVLCLFPRLQLLAWFCATTVLASARPLRYVFGSDSISAHPANDGTTPSVTNPFAQMHANALSGH